MATARTWWRRGGKRAFDLLAAAILGPLVLPVAGVCAIAVWAVDGTPVLFRQSRVGRRGRPFEILKFRTMRAAAGPLVTASGDPRITGLGRWLRRTKLDELPQWWNVLRGDMSLVGPRPELPAYVAVEPRSWRIMADLRPGITDWASLVFHDEESVLQRHAGTPEFYQRRLMPRKLALARLYHRRLSLGTDLVILAATACLALGLRRAVAVVIGRRLVAGARAGF